MTIRNLSTIRPDPEDILLQLRDGLSTRDSWKDILTSAVGETITEYVAAIGGLDEYAIERYFTECFIETARLDSSVYGGIRQLGVRLSRKIPARMVVTFVNASSTDPYAYQSFTQFILNDVKLYNFDSFVLAPNETRQVVLYEGAVKSYDYTATGKDFQTIISKENDFVVANSHVQVLYNNVEVPIYQEGLWNFRGSGDNPLNTNRACEDLTTRDGRLQIIFGNDLFAFKPIAGGSITVKFAVTKGVQGNDSSLGNQKITYSGQPADVTITSGALIGGQDETLAKTYKAIGAQLFAAQERGVRQKDMEAIALTYEDTNGNLDGTYLKIYDAKFEGQRDLNTSNNAFMNLCRVWLLYDTDAATNTVGGSVPFSSENTFVTNLWNPFITWFQKKAMYSLRFFYMPNPGGTVAQVARPFTIDFNIAAKIHCANFADLISIRTKIETALQEYTAIGPRTIARDIYLSDIVSIIKGADRAIDFVEVYTPTTNVITSRTSLKPSASIVTAANPLNVLAADTYSYRITANFDYATSAETSPTEIISVVVADADKNITLSWTALTGAVSYNVYGRKSDGSFGLLATVAGTTWTDDNTITADTGTQPPTMDNSGMRYPKLGTITLDMVYTYRPQI